LVLKIVISLKTASQQHVAGKRKRAFVACRHRSREICFGHALKIESHSTAVDFAAQISCSAMQSISQWTSSSDTSKGFAPSYEKGYIYRSRRDVVRQSRKIWRVQGKSISLFCKCV